MPKKKAKIKKKKTAAQNPPSHKATARQGKKIAKRRVLKHKKNIRRNTKPVGNFVYKINLREENSNTFFTNLISESIKQSRAQNHLEQTPVPRPVEKFADFDSSSAPVKPPVKFANILDPRIVPFDSNAQEKKKFFTKGVLYSVLAGLILAGIFSAILYVFAEPPTSKYTFGETLDPNCSPGDTNCSVDTPAQYSFSSNDFSGTGGFTTTGTITAGTLSVGSAYTFPTADGTNGQVLTTNGSGTVTWSAGGGSMTYPGAGIAVSTGSAWDTSLSATNLSSLAGLSYASTSFVKMTGAGTFSLDTSAYQASDATLTSLAGLSAVQGDLVYASGSDIYALLNKDTTATRYLSNTGTSNNPAWAQINLANGVTGILPLANGGTAANLTAVNGGIVYSGASALAISAAGSSGQILQSAGAATPVWTTATYPATTTANQLLYSSANNIVAGLSSGNSSVLVTDGSGTPSFSTTLPASIILSNTTYLGASTGVGLSATNGVLTLAGTGDGQDENLTVDFNTTANTVAFSTGTGVTILDFGSLNLATTGFVTAGDIQINGGAAFGGAVNMAGLTASKPVFTDASKNLTSSGIVAVAQGGTGLSTIAAGSIFAANSLDTFTAINSTEGTKILTNTDGTITWETSAPMTYPGAGIAVSTGSAWGASLTDSHTNWDAAYTHKTTLDAISGLIFGDGAGNYSAKTIGADVQAYDEELAGLAGLSYSSGTPFVKMTGSGAFSLDTTSYATSGDMALYVPYTGASTNVNLGAHNLTVDTNTLFVDSSSDRVGIGTTSPGAPLQVGIGATSNSTDSQILIARDVDGSGGNGHGFSDSSDITRSGGIGYNSFDARVNFEGTEDYDHYAGFQYAPTYESSGTIDNMYGLYIAAPTNTGGGTITNNWGVYVASDLTNYFGSNVGIGTTSPGTYLDGTAGLGVYNATQPGISLGTSSQGYLWYIANDDKLRLWDSTDNADRLVIDGTGNVGIGTTNPGALLDLGTAGTTQGVARFEGATSGYVGLAAPATGDSTTYTLPATSASGLLSNSGGTLSWDTTTYVTSGDSNLYVPYTGATGAVDLGAQNLTSTGIGTFGKLVVNTSDLVVNAASYANKVGIGTATPGSKLDILTTSGANLRLSYDALNYTTFTTSNTGNLTIATASSTTGGDILFTPASSGDLSLLSDTGTLTLGGFGNTNNETLTYDFETTADTVGVSTGTSVTKVDFADTITVEAGVFNLITESSGYQVDGMRVISADGSSGTENLFLGQSGNFSLTGTKNILAGYQAGNALTTGYGNQFMGYQAGYATTTGSNDVFIGEQAGYTNITGNANVFLGYQAGYYETGSNKLFIDNQKRASESDARTKALVYGVFDATVANQSLLVNGNTDFSAGLTTLYYTSSGDAPVLTTNGQVAVALMGGSDPYIYFQAGGSTYRILGSSSFEISPHETVDALSGEKMEIGDFVIGMIDRELPNGGGKENSLHGTWVKWDSVKEQLIEEIRSSGDILPEGSWAEGSPLDPKTKIKGVDTSSMLEKVKNVLFSLGISIKDGITQIKELVVEKLTVRTARIQKIEMVDSATGEIYCTWIQNGVWKKAAGDCASVKVSTDVQEGPSIDEIEQPEPTPSSDGAPVATGGSNDVFKKTHIDSVASLSDITVDFGTGLSLLALPSSINVSAGGSTQGLLVAWDNGSPAYNANSAGTYYFSGTFNDLPQNISNPDNLKASVYVVVSPELAPEPEKKDKEKKVAPEEQGKKEKKDSIIDDIIPSLEKLIPSSENIQEIVEGMQEAAAGLINGATSFLNWIFRLNFSIENFTDPIRTSLQETTPRLMELQTASLLNVFRQAWESVVDFVSPAIESAPSPKEIKGTFDDTQKNIVREMDRLGGSVIKNQTASLLESLEYLWNKLLKQD